MLTAGLSCRAEGALSLQPLVRQSSFLGHRFCHDTQQHTNGRAMANIPFAVPLEDERNQNVSYVYIAMIHTYMSRRRFQNHLYNSHRLFHRPRDPEKPKTYKSGEIKVSDTELLKMLIDFNEPNALTIYLEWLEI